MKKSTLSRGIMNIIKSFLYHCYWFNRKSQHYVLDNWICYVTFKEKIQYYKRYPLAWIKFMWLSKNQILKGKIYKEYQYSFWGNWL